jgi:hypothetical protein
LDSPDRFAGDPQRLTAGGQDAHAGAGAEQRVGKWAAPFQEVLAVVQHQQQRASVKPTQQGIEYRPVAFRA